MEIRATAVGRKLHTRVLPRHARPEFEWGAACFVRVSVTGKSFRHQRRVLLRVERARTVTVAHAGGDRERTRIQRVL